MATALPSPARRISFFAYGLIVYLLFLGVFIYAALFIAGLWVPKSIDSGAVGPRSAAILINALLLGLFVLQHTIMARPAFKQWWTRFIPRPIERSTYVLATCGVLVLLYWQWRPMPDAVWRVDSPLLRMALHGAYGFGWSLVLYASFCIDHFELFGLRQVVLALQGKPYTHPPFVRPWLYTMVRNPLMLGFLMAFWSAPDMSQGRLLFAAMSSFYIVCIGIQFEERDLLKILGEDYRLYRERTPMLLPRPRRRDGA